MGQNKRQSMFATKTRTQTTTLTSLGIQSFLPSSSPFLSPLPPPILTLPLSPIPSNPYPSSLPYPLQSLPFLSPLPPPILPLPLSPYPLQSLPFLSPPTPSNPPPSSLPYPLQSLPFLSPLPPPILTLPLSRGHCSDSTYRSWVQRSFTSDFCFGASGGLGSAQHKKVKGRGTCAQGTN